MRGTTDERDFCHGALAAAVDQSSHGPGTVRIDPASGSFTATPREASGADDG
jgi:hypothetical protein